MCVPVNLAIPPLVIDSEEIIVYAYKGAYTRMFTAESFIITKNWKKPKRPYLGDFFGGGFF